MNIKTNILLQEWQKDFVRGFFANTKGSTHTILSPRQKGKTLVCTLVIMKISLENPGRFSIMLEPTLKQARKVFKEIVKVNSGNNLIKKANESLLEITFINDSVLQFLSAEQGSDAMRGWTVSGVLIIDESAFIPDEIYQALLATTNVFRAPVILVSTPRFKTGFFYESFQNGINHQPNCYSYDWSKYDTSMLMSAEKLEYYRRTLPDIKFRQEFLGQFCDINTESAFKEFMHVISNQIGERFNRKYKFDECPPGYWEECYFGIDWASGTGKDSTAISIFNNLKQQIGLYYFNDKDETTTINFIIDLIKKYNPRTIKAESNSIGEIFCGLLQKAIKNNNLRTNLIKFNTNNNSKNRLISQLQVAIQNNDIQLLDDEELKIQFNHYMPEMTKSGKVTYNGKDAHDDIVIATGLAYDCCKKTSYIIL